MGSERTRGRRDDAGAASLEFAALSAVVALLVGAVAAAFAGSAPAIGDTVRAGLCRILTLGQGSCALPSSTYADTHRPSEPCVTSANTESLSVNGAVVFVRGEQGARYELAKLSDGRYRVTRMEERSLGAELGVGYSGAIIVNDRTYGGGATADVGADVALRGGQVWYTANEAEALRLVEEAKRTGVEDVALGHGPARQLWEAGQNLWGRASGDDGPEIPRADDVIVEGGIVLNGSAEGRAAIGSGAKVSLQDATGLGARMSKDGRTTVYLRSTLSGEIEVNGPGTDFGEGGVEGGKAGGKAQLVTAVTFNSAGEMVSVSVTGVASGETAGLVAGLFSDSDSAELSGNQFARTGTYQATLPLRNETDRAAAVAFLASTGVTQLQLGGVGLLGGAPAVPGRDVVGAAVDVYKFVKLAKADGVVTRQEFDDSSSTNGGYFNVKAGIEFGLGGAYTTAHQESLGAQYWDGRQWATWKGCKG